jgi:hypothetical protein
VISGAFNRSNGQGAPNANARSIRPGFGTNIKPQANTSLAILSTGNAADQSDTMPGFAPFQGGTDLGPTPPSPPTGWPPTTTTCRTSRLPRAAGRLTGNDTIQLKLRVRVPTNALSFSTKIYFFSSEYPEWVCSPYNDFFVTLVDSAGAGNPADKNIAIYKDPQDKLFPLGVNLVKTARPVRAVQERRRSAAAAGPSPATTSAASASSELVGTGFDIYNPAPQFPNDPGYCGNANQVGGGDRLARDVRQRPARRDHGAAVRPLGHRRRVVRLGRAARRLPVVRAGLRAWREAGLIPSVLTARSVARSDPRI